MLTSMLGTLLAAAAVCGLAVVLGQAIVTLCGGRAWSPIAAPVGLSAAMTVAIAAPRLPGRANTTAVLLLLLAIAAVVVLVRRRARPPLSLLLCGLPALLFAIVPFIANGHEGILGVSINNDMTAHLGLAEAYQSEVVARVTGFPTGYPAGAHALAASVAQGLGVRIDVAFTGLTIAVIVMLAWVASGFVTAATRGGQAVFATAVAMPFLVAGYYGQGSFKELIEVLYVVAVAVYLTSRDPSSGRLQWLPLAFMLAGTVAVYSAYGLAWPFIAIAAWLAVAAGAALLRGSLRQAVGDARAALVPVLIGVAGLVIILAPQARRVLDFTASTGTNNTGIEVTSLGNLVGPLWTQTALGIWDNGDYRFASIDPLHQGIWSGIAIVLLVVGVVWWTRRGSLILPLTALGAGLVWWYSDRTQSPYVAAKALLIVSPLLVALALRPWIEEAAARHWRYAWWAVGPALVAAVFAFKIGDSSLNALRYAKVGPVDDVTQLRSLQRTIGTDRTLFLGNSDFTLWNLAGTQVQAPVIGYVVVPTRPERPWAFGQNLDVDSLDAATLNQYRWVITPRDALGSEMPEGLRLVRSSPRFDLYRRDTPIAPRGVFNEDESGIGKLSCRTRTGRAVLRAGGVAGLANPRYAVPGSTIGAGDTAVVPLRLTAGTWDIVASYNGPFATTWKAPGMKTAHLPAYLDRPGPRWPVGRVKLTRATTLPVTITADDPLLSSPSNSVTISLVGAQKVQRQQVVPLRQACGRYIDWYRPAPSASR